MLFHVFSLGYELRTNVKYLLGFTKGCFVRAFWCAEAQQQNFLCMVPDGEEYEIWQGKILPVHKLSFKRKICELKFLSS